MKSMKKVFALVLALVLVMSMSVSAFALGDGLLHGTGVPPTNTATCSTYRADQVTPSTGTVTVTLVMEAGNAFSWDYEYGYSIPDSGFYAIETKTFYNVVDGVTVMDLLNAVDNSNSYGLEFDIVTSQQFPKGYLSTVSRHVSGQTADWEGNGQWGFDGWVFRVNDKFPVEAVNGGYQGVAAEDTYLANGDIVHFFYDAPSNFDDDTMTAANYVRARYVVAQGGNYVQMESHDTFIDQENDWDFYVNAYTPLSAGVAVTIYSANNPTVGTTYYTDSNGVINCNLSAGTYIAKTASSFFDFEDTDWEDYFDNETYFEYTSAYSVFTV